MRGQLDQFLQQRLDSGVIHEPRGYFDIMSLDTSTHSNSTRIYNITYSAPGAFRNGEARPVILTHAAFALGNYDQEGNVVAEEFIQRVGVTMQRHNTFYMNKQAFPAPLWSNKIVALSDLCFGTSAWQFADGKHVAKNGGGSFVLSARDTLEVMVEVQNAANLAYTIRVTVSFTGIGMLSQRPYFLSSSRDVSSSVAATNMLIPNDYRNDGAEPILITDMNVHTTGEADGVEDATAGQIRRIFINVRQRGNGTSASWFQGPHTATIEAPRIPATLLGITGGRAIIHEFPDPVVLDPGDEIIVIARASRFGVNVSGALPDFILHAGLLGYTVVR